MTFLVRMAQITYRDVARKAGVSMTTVSLALRGSSSITEETSRRVRDAAEELGYRPNPLVAALMTSLRSKRRQSVEAILGVISPTAHAHRSRVHPGARQFHELAAEHARACGYQTEEIVLDHVESAHRDLDRILHAKRVTGLLLADAGGLTTRIDLDWSRYSVVRIGSRHPPLMFHTVTTDHFALIQTALDETLARGARRVGLILPRWIREVTGDQFAAAWALRRHVQGDTRLASLLLCDELHKGDVLDWVRREKPDVVITPDHNVLMWLRGAGIRVPEDIGLVHTDTTHPWWPFSGMEQDRATMVRFAVGLLISECNHNHRGQPEQPVLTGTPAFWRDGETLRARQAE